MFRGRRLLFGLTMLPWAMAGASAQTLTMGVGAPVSSLDPHYHMLRSNNEVAQMVFDGLLSTDAQARLQPGLAESWRAVGEDVWEFTLREGVRFHDGTPLTTDDIVYTFERIPQVRGPGASFSTMVRPVQRLEVVDARTIRMQTNGPAPLLPIYLSQVMILNRRIHAEATTGAFNSGRAAIGTGPFRVVSHANGDRIVMERNDQYWAPKPHWATVTYRMITNDAARTAALLSGDVDIIDQISTSDLERLRRDNRFHVAEATSLRVMYITLDGTREPPVPLLIASGDRNPLADLRVRRALAMAIDRSQLVERVMEGAALATTQFMPPNTFGYIPDRPVPAADLAGARRLLAEAGYPQGFQITLIGSNDRYMNDARVVQAIGQMWTRIGERTTVEAQPYATFIGRATRREAPAALLTWGNSTGETSVMLNSVLRTPDRDRGHGAANRLLYSNPTMDALVAAAEIEMDAGKREDLLRRATAAVLDDGMLVPLYLQNALWAMRSGITYEARMDERNDPTTVVPVAR